MDAKYVITATGEVAIFSKYLGMEHAEIAGMMGGYIVDGSVSGAAFCSLLGDQIVTFGRSTSTGLSAQPEDAKTLTGLLHSNGMVLVFYDRELGWIATNAPEAFEHDKQSPCTPVTLADARIFK
jgi:hypothetical protein